MANVLGALLGTLFSAFVLIELLGFGGTLQVAGALNGVLAFLALWLSFRMARALAIEKPAYGPTTGSGLYGLPRGTVLLLLFTTGLISMGLEVIWIRQFTPHLGNVCLRLRLHLRADILLATLVGSRDYRSWANSHSAGESASAWSSLALFAVIPVLAADPRLAALPIPGLDGVRLAGIFFFCALAGFLTPLLVDSWSAGDPNRAGRAYAVNVAGCIVGPLVAGFCLLPSIGERWATVVLAIPLFAIAALTSLHRPSAETVDGLDPKLKFAIATVAAILVLVISRDYETKYPIREVRRDYTATVVAAGTGFDRDLLVNGIGMTGLNPITKYMAHLPLALMSRPPQNALVICFGMGTTFRSVLSWGIPTTAVDLVPSVPALFGYYHSDAPKLLSSPLARIVVDDGRRFLDGSNETYDVIIVDPPPPAAAPGSSLLYSLDFYAVVKRHLRSDGILQIWYPAWFGDAASTSAVTKALTESFPYVRAFQLYDGHGIHFLASMQPIPESTGSALTAHMRSAAQTDFVESGPRANAEQQFDVLLSKEVNLQQLLDAAPRGASDSR